jgi:alkylated DNA repair dioxygenase AlkB
VISLTDDNSSWIYYIPKWFRRIYNHCIAEHELHLSYADWFQRVWELHPPQYQTIKMFGKDVLTPRYQQMYGRPGRVSGVLFEAKPIPTEMELVVRLLQAFVISPQTGESYLTSLLINWFANGDHCISAHSDDESHLHHNSPVFSLSLGATRRFVITPRANTSAANPKKMELLLNDGDLVIMGGAMQKTHKHAVPKMKKSAGKRMSVTMRCYK